MLPREIEYFQAVVETGNFYEAAEACHVSQSAISQQIKKLEAELGVALLKRHNRTFSLTPAGSYFYGQSLKLKKQLNAIIEKTREIAKPKPAALRIGCFTGVEARQVSQAVMAFSQIYPDVDLSVTVGSHDELYYGMEQGTIDLAINDQRRAFSDTYENIVLAQSQIQIEIAASHPLAKQNQIQIEELEGLDCIVVATNKSQADEQNYFQQIVGIRSPFVFVSSLQEARLLLLSGKAYLPVDVLEGSEWFDLSVSRLPLCRNGQMVYKNCCLFWKKENTTRMVEAFADLLKEQFGLLD